MLFRSGVLWEDRLPIFVFGAAVNVVDWISLGHLRVGPNLSEVGFLNQNKVNRRAHRRSYGKDGMNGDVVFMGVLGKNNEIRRNRDGCRGGRGMLRRQIGLIIIWNGGKMNKVFKKRIKSVLWLYNIHEENT